MFLRLLLESFLRQRRRKLLAGLGIALGMTTVTAMIAIGTSMGDRVRQELTNTFGANLIVYPKAETLEVDLSGLKLKPSSGGASLSESDLVKLKQIFWRNNITNIAPEISTAAAITAGEDKPVATGTTPPEAKFAKAKATILGVWFDHQLVYGKQGGETMRSGSLSAHPWWKINGSWPVEGNKQAVAGAKLAASLGLHVGDTATVGADTFLISGILTSGDESEDALLVPLDQVHNLQASGTTERVYVTALTKPEDDFARRDPDSLSPMLRDRWYCSPYANSIVYQINEALPGAHAEQIRRISQNEDRVLSRISGLMWLVSLGSLLAASLAVAAAMATAILERRQEIALMRSIGATRLLIGFLFLSEAGLLAIMAGAIGYLAGSLLARGVGSAVFAVPIQWNPVLLPIVLSLAVLIAIIGSMPSISKALALDPSAALRGDV